MTGYWQSICHYVSRENKPMITNVTNISSYRTPKNPANEQTPEKFRLSLFSQQPVLAAGFAAALPENFEMIETFSDLETLEARMAEAPSDILVLEGVAALSLEVISRLRTTAPDLKIVLWVDRAPTEFISQCVGLGVLGVIRRKSSLSAYMDCLMDAARGRISVDREFTSELLAGKRIRLTPRERQLVGLLTQGLANKELAWQLGLTEGTVKVYMSRLFDKVGVADRFELALMALRNTSLESGSLPKTGGDVSSWIPAVIVNQPASAAA